MALCSCAVKRVAGFWEPGVYSVARAPARALVLVYAWCVVNARFVRRPSCVSMSGRVSLTRVDYLQHVHVHVRLCASARRGRRERVDP